MQPTLFAAQDYPVKPIGLVVTFPAGGPSDASARNFAQLLSQRLGQQIIIDNRPARAAPSAQEWRQGLPGWLHLYCSGHT